MNSKRQTVWLVSMLSLMVVLSAYYLFTDDVEDMDYASGGLAGDEVTLEHQELDFDDPLASLEGDGNKSDEQILQEFDSIETWNNDYFTSLQWERLEKHAREQESLMAQINTEDGEAAMAPTAEVYTELEQLDTQYDKIIDMEERLMQDYENVFMSEEEGRWTVALKADQLERSQAVSIVDMIAQELNVHPGKIALELK